MSKKTSTVETRQSSEYRQILLNKRASALAGLGAKAHQLANAGRVCEEDQAQYSLEEAVSLRLNGLEYMQLRQIQEALDRLELGEYGVCLSCEDSDSDQTAACGALGEILCEMPGENRGRFHE